MTSQDRTNGDPGPYRGSPDAGPPPAGGGPYPYGPPPRAPYAPRGGPGTPQPPAPGGYRHQGPGMNGQSSGIYAPAPRMYVQSPRTNTMAILAIVFTFICAPLGIVFGAIARRQIARSGEEGLTMATVAFVVGIVLTAVGLLVFVGYIVVIALFISHVHDFPVPSGNPFVTPSGQGV